MKNYFITNCLDNQFIKKCRHQNSLLAKVNLNIKKNQSLNTVMIRISALLGGAYSRGALKRSAYKSFR